MLMLALGIILNAQILLLLFDSISIYKSSFTKAFQTKTVPVRQYEYNKLEVKV